jgi:hypothetical protein
LLSGSPVAIVCETWKREREREREREYKEPRLQNTRNKQTTWGKKKRMELRTMFVWCAED